MAFAFHNTISVYIFSWKCFLKFSLPIQFLFFFSFFWGVGSKIQLKSHLSLSLIFLCHSDPSLVINCFSKSDPINLGKNSLIPGALELFSSFFILYSLLFICLFILLFVHPSIYQLFNECLACTRLSARFWENRKKEKQKKKEKQSLAYALKNYIV